MQNTKKCAFAKKKKKKKTNKQLRGSFFNKMTKPSSSLTSRVNNTKFGNK